MESSVVAAVVEMLGEGSRDEFRAEAIMVTSFNTVLDLWPNSQDQI